MKIEGPLIQGKFVYRPNRFIVMAEVDGKIVRGCLSLAANCTDKEIKTIEGIESNDTLSPIQQAFLDAGAAQCGFCTPGMIMAATALASSNRKLSDEEIREGLSGNLCRCSGYVKIIDAVRSICGVKPK